MEPKQAAVRIPASALAPGPTLYPWDVSSAVAEMQELLRAHGFNVAVDGDFNWKTEAAVKIYQKQHNLRIDGIVGPQTWRSLKTTVKPGTRLLHEGLAGADVFELQGLLQIQGYGLKRDGLFGPATKRAVLAFQRLHQLIEDGKVHSVTWTLLGEKTLPAQNRKRRLFWGRYSGQD